MTGRDANHDSRWDFVQENEWTPDNTHRDNPPTPRRDANQLAADVRAGMVAHTQDPKWGHGTGCTRCTALAALDELVALVGTLQQRLDHLTDACIREADKVLAAEAALADLTDKHEHLLSEFNYESWRGDHLVYAREWDEFNEWQRNGKQALATTRQALAEIVARAQTRRTGIKMDGTETWGVPIVGELHDIALRALTATGTEEQT